MYIYICAYIPFYLYKWKYVIRLIPAFSTLLYMLELVPCWRLLESSYSFICPHCVSLCSSDMLYLTRPRMVTISALSMFAFTKEMFQ